MSEQPDSPFEPTDAPTGPEGPETSVEASGGPLDRLFDGDAHGPPVQEIESNYGIEGPWAIFLRGAVRTATGSGIPPIFELALGGGLGFVQLQRGDSPELASADESGSQEMPDVPEGNPEPDAGPLGE